MVSDDIVRHHSDAPFGSEPSHLISFSKNRKNAKNRMSVTKRTLQFFSKVPCFPGTTIDIMNVTLYCFVIATPNPKRFRYKIDPALWPNEPVGLV